MNLRPRRPEPPRVDITPLIDVVFLMLIFFMVSTTFDKQTQLKVDLPSASSQEEQEEERNEPIEVTIDRKGHFYVNEQELVTHDAPTLQRAIQKIAKGKTDLPLIVSGDRNAPLQAMVTVMDVTAQLGMRRLSIKAAQNRDGP